MNTLPAGILDSNFEWFTNDNENPFGFTDGQRLSFEQVPFSIIAPFMRLFLSEGNAKNYSNFKKWICANFWQLDSIPDLDLTTGNINKEPSIEPFGFTEKEIEIIKAIKSGLPAKLLLDQLGIKEGTMNCHKVNIYRKANVHNDKELILFAFKYGL